MTPTPITTASDVVTAAMGIAKDAAEGGLSPATLEAELQAELRAVFGVVVGPEDPAWPVQLDVARGVLAHGGIPTDELSEWLAVQRRREAPDAPEPDQTPPEPVSVPSEPRSPETVETVATTEAEPVAEVVAPAPVLKAVPPVETDGYDPLAGWQPGGARR